MPQVVDKMKGAKGAAVAAADARLASTYLKSMVQKK